MWRLLLNNQQPFDFLVQSPVSTFQHITTSQPTEHTASPGPTVNSSASSSNSNQTSAAPEEKSYDRPSTAFSPSPNQSLALSEQGGGNGPETSMSGGTMETDATNRIITTQSTMSVSRAASGWTSPDGSPTQTTDIDGIPVLFFDGYVDQYFDPNLFKSEKNQGVCYLCQEPCLEKQDLISTGCGCKAIIHQECYSNLLEYGHNFKMNPENANRNHMQQGTFQRHHLDRMQLGGELPRITRMCGHCNRACLGKFNDQFDFTSLALRRFNRLTLAKRQKQWSTVLPPIMFSLEQIIKSIRHDWRSNVSTNNIVLSELVAKLSRCYAVVGRFTAQSDGRDVAVTSGLWSAVIAMAMCGNFTNMGVSSMPFIMDVLFKPFGGKTTSATARTFVPVVFTYLLKLLQNTTNGVVVGKRTGDSNRARCLDIAHKHKRSQQYLLNILNSNMQEVDETLYKWCLDTLISFMKFHAGFVIESVESSETKDGDTCMARVPLVPDKTIYLAETMFDYLCTHLSDFLRGIYDDGLVHKLWYHEVYQNQHNEQINDHRIDRLNEMIEQHSLDESLTSMCSYTY